MIDLRLSDFSLHLVSFGSISQYFATLYQNNENQKNILRHFVVTLHIEMFNFITNQV